MAPILSIIVACACLVGCDGKIPSQSRRESDSPAAETVPA